MNEDVAVIGIGCRFPGADNIDEFWKVLENGENHIVDIPPERWNNDAFYSEDQTEKGKLYVKKAAFLNHYDEWDNKLFGISDSEASQVDPQQRYVLECVHMAMEDGGITRKQLNGSPTGVYIGAMSSDYKGLFDFDHESDTTYTATGGNNAIISARVSYVYNLQGPSMVIDTACSSSMTSIHLGCQAIKTGDCDMAICGGVNSLLCPDMFFIICRARMLSPDCQCQTFCDKANGYVRGEGCGIVILKSYKKALEDGNKMWAVLKTRLNQDGHAAQPITAPSGEQQQKLLYQIYSHYGMDPTALQYVECHGTGTQIGDAIEVNAIGQFIMSQRHNLNSTGRDIHFGGKVQNDESNVSVDNSSKQNSAIERQCHLNNQTILVGSVKTNIGHLEAAAGVAGLIKVLLMMEKGKFVPSLHVKLDKSNIKKTIKFKEYALDVAVDVTSWYPNEKGERMSCLNSFGFGGSNSHVIVIQKKNSKITRERTTGKKYKCIAMSAIDKPSLQKALFALDSDLSNKAVDLQNVSFTSIYHRDHFTSRTLLFGKKLEEIQKQIQQKAEHIEEIESPKVFRLIFVFCGVGTSWTGMCKEMMETQPVFKDVVLKIDAIIKDYTDMKISEKFQEDSNYHDPFLNHIALFCCQIALYTLWQSWGICPEAIIGQSVGEVAAAYASGALELEDAVKVIYFRSRYLADLTEGTMMVVGNVEGKELMECFGENEGKVTVAGYNSPTAFTLSGDMTAVADIKVALENIKKEKDKDIMMKYLSVPCAYHSHYVDKCTGKIEFQLKDIKGRKTNVDHFSTVTGKLAVDDEFCTGKYWAENIRKPVKFMQAVTSAVRPNVLNVFVEIGPKPVLRAHILNILSGKSVDGICLPSINERKEMVSMNSALVKLYELGAEINWENIVPKDGVVVAVPRYVFNGVRRLHIPQKHQKLLQGVAETSDAHMYVRQNSGNNRSYTLKVSKEKTPFVFDHLFHGNVLVPGATYIEAAFEVGHRISNHTSFESSVSVNFVQTLVPQEEKQYVVEIEVTKDESDLSEHFVVKNDERMLCFGTISERTESERDTLDIYPIFERCSSHKTREDCYATLEKFHFKYGESMSVIHQAWSSETECIVELRLPKTVISQRQSTQLHPAVIDGMFQGVATMTIFDTNIEPHIPKSIESIVINRPPRTEMFSYSYILKNRQNGTHFNCLLLSKEGRVIAEVHDFFLSKIASQNTTHPGLYYTLRWQEMFVEKNKQADEKKHMSNSLLLFGTKRFIDCYKNTYGSAFVCREICESATENETCVKEIVQQKDTRLCLKSVIFAPCYHVDQIEMKTGLSVFEKSRLLFMTLASILKILKAENYDIPVYVVTENVAYHFHKHDISKSNIIGAELWGLVRSAMLENTYAPCTLIDMALSSDNASALINLVQHGARGINELTIRDGIVFRAEITEDISIHLEETLTRRINVDASDNITLKSVNCSFLKDLYFELQSEVGEISCEENTCHVRLHSICLHNPALYPVSSELKDTERNIWPEDNKSGYQVMCLEGVGWSRDMNILASKPNLGFCYPVDVSTFVSIPSECVYKLEEIPSYIPGLIISSVILYEILQLCKTSSSVCFVVEKNSGIMCQIITKTFKQHGHGLLSIEAKKKMLCFAEKNDAETVVCLTTITFKQIAQLRVHYPHIKNIISLGQYFPPYMKIWVEHNIDGLVVDVLKSEDVLSSFALRRNVPEVVKTFKHADMLSTENISITETEDHQTDLLRLPFPVLNMCLSNDGDSEVNLRVSEKNLFRKDSCYILVGGMTGLGWETLQILAELGAGNIATISRRSPSKEKKKQIAEIQESYDCKIVPLQADITDIEAVKHALTILLKKTGNSTVRGVFHGGGVICDKLLKSMNSEEAVKPMLPKILGTLNLHECTLNFPLDFFVMHSSIASIFGNIGQANYAAGNAFEDSFAQYRRSKGLCGQSINWGPLSVGMSTGQKSLEHILASEGYKFLDPNDIRKCFVRALLLDQVQILCAKLDWWKIRQQPIAKLYPGKFSKVFGMYEKSMTVSSDKKHMLDFEMYSTSEEEGKKKMIFELLKTIIMTEVLIDEAALEKDTELVKIGVDSMTATSLVSSILEATSIRIPLGLFFEESTSVQTLITYIQENIPVERVSDKTACFDKTEERFNTLLEGNVTFMQKLILEDMRRGLKEDNYTYQIDFEFDGVSFDASDWRVVMNHIININPDLRRTYKFNTDGTYESKLVPMNEINLDIEEVKFDSICTEDAEDKRNSKIFDMSKELAVKLNVSTKDNKTRTRLFIHRVAADLGGLTVLFQDISCCFIAYKRKLSLPNKDSKISVNEALLRSLKPQRRDMQLFWREQLSANIEPFTYGKSLKSVLDEEKHEFLSRHIPSLLTHQIFEYIQKRGISLFSFLAATYMAVIHEKTKQEVIVLGFPTSMRNYIPGLKSYVGRAGNMIPIIGDFRDIGTTLKYVMKFSNMLHLLNQFGSYPFQLIKDEIKSETLKQHICRHLFAIDNMTAMNRVVEQADAKIKICKVFHVPSAHESILQAVYDTAEKDITLNFDFNSEALTFDEAKLIIDRIEDLLSVFMEKENENLHDILHERITFAAEPVVLNLVSSIKISEDKEARPLSKETFQMNKCRMVLREDRFVWQTSEGTDHYVLLKLAKESSVDGIEELVISWVAEDDSHISELQINMISEVAVQETKGVSSILMRTNSGWHAFKAESKAKAYDWIDTLKRENSKLVPANMRTVEHCHL